ncbi:hypothetical protein KC363_g176 [Hortaea werneckii]|nr:hypothetical protein KC363_g176 [Hortaea werneckii]
MLYAIESDSTDACLAKPLYQIRRDFGLLFPTPLTCVAGCVARYGSVLRLRLRWEATYTLGSPWSARYQGPSNMASISSRLCPANSGTTKNTYIKDTKHHPAKNRNAPHGRSAPKLHRKSVAGSARLQRQIRKATPKDLEPLATVPKSLVG